MNRYYKLKNGDILDRATDTTISRDRLLEILNSVERFFHIDDNSEVKDELDGNEDSVLD